MSLRSIVIKKYCHYSNNNPVAKRENMLKQDFIATDINQKWCTDITYIHTLKDGWAYSTSMAAELALKAVENACLNVKDPTGIIIQSDLGTQYRSDLFENYLTKQKICHSYSRKGCPYDNTCIESFHSLLKKEEVNLKTYIDSKDAFDAIFEYIESWYNHKSIHSSLNYQTPKAVYTTSQGAV